MSPQNKLEDIFNFLSFQISIAPHLTITARYDLHSLSD